MHTFSFFTATILVAGLFALPRPGQAMTMDECVALALRNNPGLNKNQVNVSLAEQEIRSQKAGNFGRLDFVSGYTHYNTARTLTPMTPATMAGDPASVPTTRNLFSSSIVYEVPLFTGFAQTRAVEIADLSRQMAQASLLLSREQLIYNVKTLYVNILSQKRQLTAQETYAASLARLHDDTAQKLTLGRLARIDLLKAAADLQNARAVARQIRANLAIMRGSLASLLAVDNLEELADIPVKASAMRASGAESIMEAENLQGLTRVKKEQLNMEKADRLVEQAKSTYYPQLNASGAYGRNYGPNDDSHSNRGDWQDQEVWQAGVNLTWNIFDFGSAKTQVQKARLAARQARLARQETELALKKNLLEATEKINTAISDYKSALAETKMTEETEAIEQVRFDQGASDITDLLLAKSRHRLARGRLIDAGYRYLSNRYYLEYLLEQGGKQEQ